MGVRNGFQKLSKFWCQGVISIDLNSLIYLMNTYRLVNSSENRPHIQPTVL